MVLLLAIVLVYSYPSINLEQNKQSDEFHKDGAKGWLIVIAPYVITYFTIEKLIMLCNMLINFFKVVSSLIPSPPLPVTLHHVFVVVVVCP